MKVLSATLSPGTRHFYADERQQAAWGRMLCGKIVKINKFFKDLETYGDDFTRTCAKCAERIDGTKRAMALEVK